MGLLETLNAIASDRGTAGKADAQLALAALVLLDKNNNIVFDADDIPGTMDRIASQISAPRWQRFDVGLEAIRQAGQANLTAPGEDAFIPLITLPSRSLIHAGFMTVTEYFLGAADMSAFEAYVVAPVFTDFIHYSGSLNSGSPDDNDIEAFTSPVAGAAPILLTAPLTLSLRTVMTVDSGDDAANYGLLTAGGFKIWLLTSRLV